VAKAREAAKLEQEQLLSQLKREFGRMVVDATTRVTGKVLTPEDQERLNRETAAPSVPLILFSTRTHEDQQGCLPCRAPAYAGVYCQRPSASQPRQKRGEAHHGTQPRSYLANPHAFQRLVRLEIEKRHALIETAEQLSPALRNQLAPDLQKKYGEDLEIGIPRKFPNLLAASASRWASHVWDGSVRGRLDSLRQELA